MTQSATVTEPVLRISDLSVAFRTGGELLTAVSQVSIDVHAGETVAVVGESGSGKSTTAAAINRLLPENGTITGGTIRFDGREMTDLAENELIRLRGAGIGLVPTYATIGAAARSVARREAGVATVQTAVTS